MPLMTLIKQKKQLLFALLAISVGLVIGGPAMATISDVGGTDAFPTPACPDDTNCRVVTGVTAYQIQIGAKKNPFLIHSSGRVVALTLDLPLLTAKQLKYFQGNYSGDPAVRVAILRPRKRRGVPYRYVLAGRSESIPLIKYFGSQPTFPLRTSLTVRRGDVVALTVDTWMPAFAMQLDAKTAWRASRKAKTCNSLDKSTHDTKGQIRVYGCLYTTAQLLYKVTVISAPKATNTATTPTAKTTKPTTKR